MKKSFLNRTIFDPNTMTWHFPDGSGVVPEEMRQDMLNAVEMKTVAGHNGVFILATLFSWKDRLKGIYNFYNINE